MRATATMVACVLLIFGVAYAQSDRGTITGTIADPAGAMIPNAQIEAKNTATGATYQTVSSSTGNYTLAQLPVGVYQLTASMSGFKQYVRTGITVMVAQILRIDINLEVGSISETVTVSADAPLLKTESGELSHVISTDRVDDLPILFVGGGIRSPYTQVNLIPGAQQISGGFGALRVNGMPGATLALRIDGQDASQTTWTNAVGMSQPGVDSIEETAIQTSNFAAEFGQVGGGLFNMTMRSGANALHGSAYWYWRNEAFNSYQPYNKPPIKIPGDKNRDRRQNFGFTAGGPVYIPKVWDGRDKTFFFWTFETNRASTRSSLWDTLPTQAYRNGDFSSPDLWTKRNLGTDAIGRPILEGTIYDPETTRTVIGTSGSYVGQSVVIRDPFPGNIMCDKDNPTLCGSAYLAVKGDPAALKLQSYIPALTDPSKSTSNYLATWQNEPVTSIHSIKIDHMLSSKMKLSGYWSLNRVKNWFPDGFEAPITTRRDIQQNTNTIRLNLDYTVSPTVLMHLGAGLMYFKFSDPAPPYDAQADLGMPRTYFKVSPTLYYLEAPLGGGMGGGNTMRQGNSMGPVAQQEQYQIKPTGVASLNWVKGNHTYKFGAEFRAESYPSYTQTPGNGWFFFSAAQTALPYLQSDRVGGGVIGFPYASYLLGFYNNGEIGQVSSFHVGKHAFAFYAQDSWKITPKLTLDYGLRWDYQTYLKETGGRIPGFGYNTPNSRFGNLPGAAFFERDGVEFAKNYPHAWGPRLGIAYRFMPKTVLRAGIGISYAQTANLEMWSLRFGSDVRFSTPSWGATDYRLRNGPAVVPVWPNFDPAQVPQFAGDPFMTSFDHNAGRPARQTMWSIGIQRELTTNMSLEVSYVGNRGAWWNSNGSLTDPNRVTPAILEAHNLSLSNSTHRTLLLTPLSAVSSADMAAYNLKVPFSGFRGTVSQSLRPYPHFGAIYVLWAPLGRTWYDSLQMKYTKRFSHGLDFTATYTYQKELTIGAETVDPAFAPVMPAVVDLNNYWANKTISGISVPHRFVFAGTYKTPTVDMYRPLSWLMKDWTIGAYLAYYSGMPIQAPAAANSPNPAQLLSLCAPQSVFGGCNTNPYYAGANASYANRVKGEPLYTLDLNTNFDPFTTFVLNPNAWSQPAPGQFGVGSPYYSDYRYRRTPSENMSLGRIFRITEGVTASIRIELNNIFNRTAIPNPTATDATAPQRRQDSNNPNSPTVSGFGRINAINAGGQRTGQLVMRLNF